MRTVVVYDSLYGNTAAIARAVADGLADAVGPGRPVEVATTVDAVDLAGVDLLLVGGPTHGANPSPRTRQFVEGLSAEALTGVAVAAFDTRTDPRTLTGVTRMLGRVFDRLGYAAPTILGMLEAKGGLPVVEGEGFIVEDKGGPLRDGEVERARSWATRVGANAAAGRTAR